MGRPAETKDRFAQYALWTKIDKWYFRMSERVERVLTALERMGRRYIREFLFEEGSEPSQLRSDWYYAFKFLLSKLYIQGRNAFKSLAEALNLEL